MEMALYYPELGYYTRQSARIGRSGDYYTGPHLHRIFGAMLGRQMEEMWDVLERPDHFRVVEIGAGMGFMAKDILDYLKAKNIFSHLLYTIVEINPWLRVHQQELLKDYLSCIAWSSEIHALDTMSSCVFSNELLDALPVRIVEMDDEMSEIYVSAKGDSLVEMKMPCSSEVKNYFKTFSTTLPRGFRTEVNLRIKDWLKEVLAHLSEGFLLTVDYGYPAHEYYSEERNRGTLLCYYHHMVGGDPYQSIGEQDLTAHVNFSSLKKWGEDFNLKTIGFCPQGTYLISLGIDEVIRELYGESPDRYEIAKMKGLLLPQGMGESHKVMVQYKGDRKMKLRGFALRNNIRKL